MMNQQRIFAVTSVLLLIASGVIIFLTLLKREGFDEVLGKPSHAEREPGSPVSIEMSLSPPAKAPETVADLEAILAQVPRLKEIPWLDSEIEREYRNAASRSCRLLPAGTPVIPDRLGISPQGDEVETLRATALSVGLQSDPAGILPKLSKGMIEGYLSGHRLLIQPEVARQGNGQAEFTGNLSAALFERSSPRVTAAPEAMIADAVSKFRLLGILEEQSEAEVARTLVLAFSYVSASGGQATSHGAERPVIDLLFLHLQPNSRRAQPEIIVFATAEGRTLFQEIQLSADYLGEIHPEILADIRFKRFTMLGQYPADPVVTRVRNRARFTLPLPAIQKRLAGRPGAPKVSFSSLLEELHAHVDPLQLFPGASALVPTK